MCFDERVRECPSGGKLSKDGCSCENVVASKPTCSTGCTLNNNGVCSVVDIAEAGFRVKNGRSWAIRKLTNLQIRN